MSTGEIRAVTRFDRIEGPASWTIERDHHLLLLHEGGSYHWLETWLDGWRTSLGDPLPGEMWFVPAGRIYRAAAQGGAVHLVEVEIRADALVVPAAARTIAAHDDAVMAGLVRALAAEEDGAGAALLASLTERFATATARPVPAAMRRRIDALMVFIQAGLETPLTVHDLAGEAGMSVNHLIANFARATGWTPAQYILRQRLRRACWFLSNRPLSVAEIAFATGFSSHAHLCAAFRRKLGMSPGDWRRRVAGRAGFDG